MIPAKCHLHREWSMDQQRGENIVSDTTAKVGSAVTGLGATIGKLAQDGVDQSKSVLRDLQESAAAAVDKTADLARKVSAPAAQAADTVQGIARDVGNQVGQAASTVYEQGARAGGSVTRYTAEQPLTALVIAGAIGYGLAYLIHRP
jgi:ElaB/YqjD/DUF883 family membrane-anchored ribosome-binding protein